MGSSHPLHDITKLEVNDRVSDRLDDNLFHLFLGIIYNSM